MREATVNHEEIRRWAKAHDARPAEVGRHKFDGEPAVLTFLYGEPKADEAELRVISWESFFAQFDLMKLVFVPAGGRDFELMRTDEKTYRRYEGKVVSSS